MKALARFVVRPADDSEAPSGDLLIGALLKQQNPALLRPGVVYEIREVFGTLTIQPIGKAAIGNSMRDTLVPVCWSHEIGHVVSTAGGRFLLTDAETAALSPTAVTP